MQQRNRYGSHQASFTKRPSFEQLESRRMLATIFWANEIDPATGILDDDNFFQDVYGENAQVARAIVNRAIDDWEAVIQSFNYASDNDADPNNDLNDTFTVTISAREPFFGVTNSVTREAVSNKPFA